MSFVTALKWSFLAELATKAIQPVVFVVLARLLTPEDFGVMTAALMVIGFSQIFWEAGMGKALIQRQADTDAAANIAFWVNIGLGIAIAGILILAADTIARRLFHDVRVAAVLQVMTLYVLLGALSSVHIALLQKQMEFKRLFWVRFATVTLPGLASIPLAWGGMGYWALVAGTLVGQVAQLVVLWGSSQWRPTLSLAPHVAGQMSRFGAWVSTSSLLAWFYVWADSLVIGTFLGSHELGLYRTGSHFSIMLFAIVVGPIAPVLYSHLSRLSQDTGRLRAAAQLVIEGLTLIAVPIAILTFSVSEAMGDVLFGQNWHGIGTIIGVMALVHGYSWVAGMNGEIYRAMGKPSYDAIVTAALLLIYLPAYLYSIQYGLAVFLWVRLALAASALVVHLFVIRALLSLSMRSIATNLLVISALCFFVALTIQHGLLPRDSTSWLRVLGGGSASLVSVGLAVYMLRRDALHRILRATISDRQV